MRQHLVLFLRAPMLGGGKRRLARDIGDVAAVHFERRMLALLLRRLARDRRWRLQVALTPRRRLRAAGVASVIQGGGDLGQRMQLALAAAPPGPVVLVGADIPDLRAAHIAAAFRLLGRHDLVFGPAVDGGFWLIGARRRPRLPPLFAAVRWSGPHALADTLASLPRDVSVAFLEG
ncbi:MAG: TIGR04282 family arsenosugar biosynthesis glycosyltransferase, partial [Stellaceae bacterium]